MTMKTVCVYILHSRDTAAAAEEEGKKCSSVIWKNLVRDERGKKLEIEEIVDCNPRHKLYWPLK